jgi:23S rRNA (uracil1939-C5)-methyltransferase
MKTKRFTPFKISRLDSLGQGVSKLTEKVVFIPKTLVGDEGEAEVMSEKKGVVFGKIKSLEKKSLNRIEPPCVHFKDCPSCHFLHVSYGQELSIKKESFQNLFRKIPLPEVEVVGAVQRLFYRNRVQLHYSLKSKLLGMRDPHTFEITPIPNCLIGLPAVLKEVKKLYDNDAWIKLAPPTPSEGHVEIYLREGEIQTSWNKSYAQGGFTQVYEGMNAELKKIIINQFYNSTIHGLLDLFAGNGNLSKDLPYKDRLCVDIYSETIPVTEDFMNQNLYNEKALERIQNKLIKKTNFQLSHLLLDPPRSGFKDLQKWLMVLKPQFVAYISCDPHTMARDLAELSDYSFSRSVLMDFFPSTFHFESVIFLERKK